MLPVTGDKRAESSLNLIGTANLWAELCRESVSLDTMGSVVVQIIPTRRLRS